MARRTKAELIQIRETTYKPPEIPERRCETCRHSFFQYGHEIRMRCDAVHIRGEPQRTTVHAYGVCGLYEAKESSDGE